MTVDSIIFRGYIIEQRTDVKSHCAIIYTTKGDYVKSIAGDIKCDGTENSIEKAMDYVNQINNKG
jgi:hypothetical protein